MKKILSTTALALAMGLPSLAMAQPASQSTNSATQTNRAELSVDARENSDLLASDLMDRDVHARSATGTRTDGASDTGLLATAMLDQTDLDGLETIGQVKEIVLSHDGQVRALVIGVGGFLGLGERDVAVPMDQVTFAYDHRDLSQVLIVVNAGADTVADWPRFERTLLADSAVVPQARTAQTAHRAEPASESPTARAPQTAHATFTRPDVTRDGYTRLGAAMVTSVLLTGQSVYDVDDRSVGTVDDLILDDDGVVTNVIIDFGGFLGIGTRQVSLDFDELTILSRGDDSSDSVRVYVDATRAAIQARPQYQAAAD